MTVVSAKIGLKVGVEIFAGFVAAKIDIVTESELYPTIFLA